MHVCLTVIDKMTLLTLLPLPFLPHVPLHTLVCFFLFLNIQFFSASTVIFLCQNCRSATP